MRDPPRPPDGESRRERLMRAALDLFTTIGFLRTTTPVLAQRAGVAEGTIYRHFKSKEELLNETYRHAQRWGLDTLGAAEPDHPHNAPARLLRLARQIVESAAKDPALVRMLLSSAHEPFLDDRSRAARRTFTTGLSQLIAMGKSDGQVRSGPAELWAQLWLSIVAFAAERIATGEWAPDSAPVGLTIEAAWDAIAARPSLSGPGGAGEDREVSRVS